MVGFFEERLFQLFFENWQRKLVAFLTAMIMWILVHNSITDSKTVPNVPVRVINLPDGKTALNLLPNGFLKKRMSLTLQGTKSIVDDLEPGDIQVLIDASQAEHNDWIVKVTKKNLVSLNPSIDLVHHITQVDNSEYILRLRPVVKERVPVYYSASGNAPPGYIFLDAWPPHFFQTVKGAEEEVKALAEKGIVVPIDLDQIDENAFAQEVPLSMLYEDEVSLPAPSSLKEISLPFHAAKEKLNDPNVAMLRLEFLKDRYLPLQAPPALRVHYPQESLSRFSPENQPLLQNQEIRQENGIYFYIGSLFAKNVSKLFLESIQGYLEITLNLHPETRSVSWSIDVINAKECEEYFVKRSIELEKVSPKGTLQEERKELLKKRFNDYLKRMELYTAPGKRFEPEVSLTEKGVLIRS